MLKHVKMASIAPVLLLPFLSYLTAHPVNPECTGIMAMYSRNGSPRGPWSAPIVIYDPSAANATKEWYSEMGIDNPTLVILDNGTSLLGGRTCTRTEHPWIARAPHWTGPYKSIDNNSQPFAQNDVEDQFMWRDHRGWWHALHHWQTGYRNRLNNGGHSYSRDGIQWTFSQTTAYTENITWTNGSYTIVGRRERPALLLDPETKAPLALFSAVADVPWGPVGGHSWLQSQPIRQKILDFPTAEFSPHPRFIQRAGALASGDDIHVGNMTVDLAKVWCNEMEDCFGFTLRMPPPTGTVNTVYFKSASRTETNGDAGWVSYIKAPPCHTHEDCSLNGLCDSSTGACKCDPQWQGSDCGILALLPADPEGGYKRDGFNQWGGNPFYSAVDNKYHVFVTEMTYGCTINDFTTNSQIVHAESSTPTGKYELTPISFTDAGSSNRSPSESNSSILVAPFATCAHASRDPVTGALVVVFEGRNRLPVSGQKQCDEI